MKVAYLKHKIDKCCIVKPTVSIAFQFWYMLYLLLYSYVLLFLYRPEAILWPEWLLYFWQLAFLLETFRVVI